MNTTTQTQPQTLTSEERMHVLVTLRKQEQKMLMDMGKYSILKTHFDEGTYAWEAIVEVLANLQTEYAFVESARSAWEKRSTPAEALEAERLTTLS